MASIRNLLIGLPPLVRGLLCCAQPTQRPMAPPSCSADESHQENARRCPSSPGPFQSNSKRTGPANTTSPPDSTTTSSRIVAAGDAGSGPTRSVAPRQTEHVLADVVL